MVCWVRNLSEEMGSLTFTRYPGVGNLTLASRKCQNPLGLQRCITIVTGLPIDVSIEEFASAVHNPLTMTYQGKKNRKTY